MKHLGPILFFGFCVVLLSDMSAVSWAGTDKDARLPAAKGPAISFDHEERIYDLGTIQQNQKGETVITFINVGTENLRIENVRGSCGCTALNLSKDTLSPGEKGEIKVSLTPGKKEGPLKKFVYLNTNDPHNKKVTLILKAKVRLDYIFDPYYISFGRIKRDELGKEKYAKIKGENLSKYTLTGIVSESPYVEARILDANKDYDVQRVVVKLKKNVPLGTFREVIKVSASHPDYPEMNVQVSALVVGHIRVQSERVYFRLGRDKEQLEQEVKLTNPRKKDFTITSTRIIKGKPLINPRVNTKSSPIEYLDPEDNDIKITIGKTNEKGECRIKLTFMRSLKQNQRIQGTLRLYTDDPEHKEVDITYFAFSPVTQTGHN